MDMYYKNATLFVNIRGFLTLEDMNMFERRIFRILEDYGIEKIIMTLEEKNKYWLDSFRKNYRMKYSGSLIIK